jgi:hypothetical protein
LDLFKKALKDYQSRQSLPGFLHERR